ncbi:hypothetical protein ACFCWY_19855 [Streptomyces sp. NPDC056362]|uniref:hypothetical protein n=1 Tax=unclassified Streptomyces TaxID=2593676 RepID=UPI0035E0E2FE
MPWVSHSRWARAMTLSEASTVDEADRVVAVAGDERLRSGTNTMRRSRMAAALGNPASAGRTTGVVDDHAGDSDLLRL